MKRRYPTVDGNCHPTSGRDMSGGTGLYPSADDPVSDDRKLGEQSGGPFHGVGGDNPYGTVLSFRRPRTRQQLMRGGLVRPHGGAKIII